MSEGLKFDTDKPRWDLLPIEQIEKIVEVYTFGAKKYAPNNWQKVEDGTERYYAALMRHLAAYRKGERVDQESGLEHLAHVAWNVIALMYFDELPKPGEIIEVPKGHSLVTVSR